MNWRRFILISINQTPLKNMQAKHWWEQQNLKLPGDDKFRLFIIAGFENTDPEKAYNFLKNSTAAKDTVTNIERTNRLNS